MVVCMVPFLAAPPALHATYAIPNGSMHGTLLAAPPALQVNPCITHPVYGYDMCGLSHQTAYTACLIQF